MKQILLLLFILNISALNAQCDENIVLLSQAEVDSFPINFGCQSLSGKLTIGKENFNTDITNLDSLYPLNDLVSLDIVNNPLLIDISGLSQLNQVNISISISNNNALTNLHGLEHIEKLSNFGITENDALVDLSALANLTRLSGTLSIYLNQSLTQIDSLSNLTYIGRVLNIVGNTKLKNIDGLKQVESIGSSVFIQNNDSLQNIDGLIGLTELNAGIYLEENGITNLDGLSNVTSVEGIFFLLRNNRLENLHGLSQLSSLGEDLYIGGNDKLQSLDGLEGIRKLQNGYLKLEYNDLLSDVSGLENLVEVNSTIAILDNPMLAECCPIYELLNGHTSSLVIVDNQSGCSSLTQIMENCVNSTHQVAHVAAVIYPNPSDQTFTFLPDGTAPYTLSCSDLFGRQLFKTDALVGNYTFDLTTSGLYLVTYADGYRKASYKILVK